MQHSGRTVSTILGSVAALLCLIVLSAAVPMEDGNWDVVLHQFNERDKFGATIIGDGSNADEVLIVSGRDATKTPIISSFVLNITDGTSRELFPSEQPAGRFGASAHSVGPNRRHAVVFGGNLDKETVTDAVELLDVDRQVWSTISSTGAARPTPRTKFGSIQINNATAVYFFGLTAQAMSDEVWELTIGEGLDVATWRKLAGTNLQLATGLSDAEKETRPIARFDPCCVHIASKSLTHCFGGTTAVGDSQDTWTFNHTSNTWKRLATSGSTVATASLDIPGTRRLAMCDLSSDQGSLYVWSGWDSTASQFVTATQLHILNLATGVWRHELPNDDGEPVARDSGKMLRVPNGNVFLFGGSSNKGGGGSSTGRQNDLWRLNPTTNKFVKVSATQVRPPQRVYHAATVSSTSIFIAFGQDGSTFLNDVWEFDTATLLWSQAASGSEEGRYACTAVSFGTTLIFYGGVLESGGYTNAIVTFNKESNPQWRTVEQVGTSLPAARAYHGAVMLPNVSVMIIMGGRSSSESFHYDAWAFELEFGIWWKVETQYSDLNGDYTGPPGRRQHGFLYDVVNNQLLVIGGLGASKTLLDRWSLSNFRQNEDNWTAVYTQLNSIVHNDVTDRAVIRMDAAIAASGSHILVCGGGISSSFPAPLLQQCYHYDAKTGKNTHIDSMPVEAVGATASYFGNKMYIFGGQLVAEAIKRPIRLNHMRVYTLPSASLCQAGHSDDANCLHCSPGTQNPSTAGGSCNVTSAGEYLVRPYETPSKCLAGRYWGSRGGSTRSYCSLCPAGSFTSESGSEACAPCTSGKCRLGATRDDITFEAEQVAEETRAFDPLNPQTFADESTPANVYYTLASILVIGFCLGAIFVQIQHVAENRVQRYYLGDAIPMIENAFFMHKKDHERGLTLMNVYAALWSDEVRSIIPGIECYSPDEIDELVSQHDEDGSGVLTISGLRLAVVAAMRKQMFGLVKGSDAYAANAEYVAWWSGNRLEGDLDDKPARLKEPWFTRIMLALRLSQTDEFKREHNLFKDGHPIYVRHTRFGGKMTWLKRFFFLAFMALLLSNFFLANLIETRGTVPAVALGEDTNEPRSRVEIVFEITTGANDTACIGAFPGGCAKNTVYTQSAGSTADVSTNMNPSCVFSPGICRISWSCSDCFVGAERSVVLTFETSPDLFAYSIGTTMTLAAGVEDPNGQEQESVQRVDFAAADTNVFRGFPASTLDVRLVATKFQTVRNRFTGATHKRFGYHSQVLQQTKGQEVQTSDFDQYFGVPIKLTMSRADTVFLIQRKPLQNPIELASSVLGAFSGLSGLFVVIVRLRDGLKRRTLDREEWRLMRAVKRNISMDLKSPTTDNTSVVPISEPVGLQKSASREIPPDIVAAAKEETDSIDMEYGSPATLWTGFKPPTAEESEQMAQKVQKTKELLAEGIPPSQCEAIFNFVISSIAEHTGDTASGAVTPGGSGGNGADLGMQSLNVPSWKGFAAFGLGDNDGSGSPANNPQPVKSPRMNSIALVATGATALYHGDRKSSKKRRESLKRGSISTNISPPDRTPNKSPEEVAIQLPEGIRRASDSNGHNNHSDGSPTRPAAFELGGVVNLNATVGGSDDDEAAPAPHELTKVETMVGHSDE